MAGCPGWVNAALSYCPGACGKCAIVMYFLEMVRENAVTELACEMYTQLDADALLRTSAGVEKPTRSGARLTASRPRVTERLAVSLIQKP